MLDSEPWWVGARRDTVVIRTVRAAMMKLHETLSVAAVTQIQGITLIRWWHVNHAAGITGDL
jgi:hypothetical protein